MATFAVLTVGLYAVLGGILAGLSFSMPGGALCTVLWVALPSTLVPTVSAVIAADTAIALYQWNAENLRLASYVT